MTPEQRAEKIVSEWADGRSLRPLSTLEEMIAAEIQAAVDEAYKRGFEDLQKHRMESNDQAYKRGVEEAAKIAENAAFQAGTVIHVAEVRQEEPYITGPEWGGHIASRIRARTSGRICDQYHCGHEACNKAREKQ